MLSEYYSGFVLAWHYLALKSVVSLLILGSVGKETTGSCLQGSCFW